MQILPVKRQDLRMRFEAKRAPGAGQAEQQALLATRSRHHTHQEDSHMTNLSLGERLARNLVQEQAQSIQAQEARARHASQEALREFQQVAQFFEDAKGYFTKAIEDQVPSKQLRIQVGRSGRSSTEACNIPIYSVLKGWDYRHDELLSLREKGAFGSLWTAFREWAQSQGLTPKWQYAHDGGGMESWWYLCVEPAAQVTAPPLRVDYSDVRLSHPRSLQVLCSTLEAYLKLADSMAKLPASATPQRLLVAHKDSIATARALHAELLGS